MHSYNSLLLFFFIAFLFLACKSAPPTTDPSQTTPSAQYQLAENWPQLPNGFVLGNPTGIGVDAHQHLFVFHRADRKWPLLGPMPDTHIRANTILQLDRDSGTLINSWGGDLFIMPHGLTVDNDNNIWVTDVALHQVFKFSHDGKLLLQLGEAKVSGKDTAHFNKPTDVAVADDGSFYVSDGYGNNRVVKFSASGQYLFEWGKKGKAPGEFNLPHSLALDEKGNVYVADRENNRIQVFDAGGKFLRQWTDESVGKIYAVHCDKKEGQLLATDYDMNVLMVPKGSDVLIFDATGKEASRFGRSGSYSGPVCNYHDVAVDKDGNVYAGDILGNRLQKFRRVAD